ncbi:carbohydrate-binding protein [Rhizobium wuzhouense]|uniref:Chitin-binding type-3 domain-containing protein n=1 Tax=Rhizobium wuzhouense TaxID=1986026 RepID=A0ABX5NMD0_9HYPH|nr:carbohydrate-binding protein [Rhizobium wuzhouense]PYB71260.1 hypothetical protein DMY87_18015 [Rhizobium wuzhouense]
MELSVAVRNAQADAFETTIGTAPKVQIFTGLRPANCATARSGTMLGNITAPSDWMSAASSGAKGLLGTWTDNSADAAGYAGYFSIMDSAGTTCHLQGIVSEAWATSKAYVVGQQASLNGNVYRCTTAGTSASSGGPSGTGTGITDGSAVWSYVGPTEMVLDNTNIAAGQAITITSFTYTRGNA